MQIDRYLITKSNMPLVYKIADKYLKSSDKKILMGLPLTFETLCFIDSIKYYIPNLIVIPQSSGKNSSLQKVVLKYLTDWNIIFFRNADKKSRIAALQKQPDIIIDCSFMLGECGIKNNLINKKTVFIEDTKTGENKIEKLKKSSNFNNPYIILDNSTLKKKYENNIGIGYSVVIALSSLGIYLPKTKIGIVGYGSVGMGVSKYLSLLGAKVYISEINPYSKKLASLKYKVLSIKELFKTADIIITATGEKDIITKKDLDNINKKLILVNAGGEDEWNSKKIFRKFKSRRIHEHIIEYNIRNNALWEVGGGNCINLVRQIAISEFIDITFSLLINLLSCVDNIKLYSGKNEIKKFYTNEYLKEITRKV